MFSQVVPFVELGMEGVQSWVSVRITVSPSSKACSESVKNDTSLVLTDWLPQNTKLFPVQNIETQRIGVIL